MVSRSGDSKQTIFYGWPRPQVLKGRKIPESLYSFGCKTVHACYTTLNSVLAKHSENVKTVKVSGHFCKLRSTKSPTVEVRLNTGSGVKEGVPKNSR